MTEKIMPVNVNKAGVTNKQREKTNEQKAREYSHLIEIEKVRAKERMITLAGTRPNSDPVENFPQGDNGKSRDIAAAKIGISGKTAEKWE